MKLSRLVPGLAAMLLGLSAFSRAHAGHLNVLPEAARAVAGGRDVDVLIAQGEIKSNIEQSIVSEYTEGGLIPALIDAKIDHDRAKKAEMDIRPLREVLSGHDVETMALGTTKAALAKVPWFQPSSITFGRDTTLAGKSAALDAAATSQIAFLEYTYDTPPDASSVRVALTIQLVNKATPAGEKPGARFSSRHLIYEQTITSVIALPSPSMQGSDNVALWVAQDGKPAREAMAAAFGQIDLLLPRALEISEADVKAMSAPDKDFIYLEGYGGHLQEGGLGGALLFDGAFVYVRTTRE